MQTNSTLPIQVTGAGAANAPQRGANGNAEGGQFSATLSREMDQRRQPPPAAAAQQPSRPQQPAKAQQADKPAASEPQSNKSTPQDQASAADGAVAQSAQAAEADSADTAQAAPDDKSSPVADMLALVASFNQALRPASAPTEAAASVPQPGQAAATLETMTRNLLADAAGGVTGAADAADGPALALPEPLVGKQLKADAGGVSPAAPFAAALDVAGTRAGAARQLADQAAPPVAGERQPLVPVMPQLAPQVQAQVASANPASAAIPARVGTPGWDNQLGQKIVWMVAGGDQSAELTLNPPDLGPMQVVLNVSGDQASVTFTASQLEVRQALENALPRLREMMSESGIALGNATVNAGAGQRQAQDGQAGGGNGGARFAGNDDASGEAARPAARTSVLGDRGMVDTFA